MMLIYILLVIIAVGVLLLSESGKKFLNFLMILVGAIAVGCIVFLTVILLNHNWSTITEVILPIVGTIFIFVLSVIWLYQTYKKIKEGKITIKSIKEKTKDTIKFEKENSFRLRK